MNNHVQTALVKSKTSPVIKTSRPPWDKLSTLMSHVNPGPKDGLGWLPADIPLGRRKKDQVKSVTALVLDIEAKTKTNSDGFKEVIGPEPPGVDEMLDTVRSNGWRCILHTTYSHHDSSILPLDQEHPRYRLIFALSRPLRPDEVRLLGLRVGDLLKISKCIDTSALEPARLFYMPRCPEERLGLFRHGSTEGEPLDVDVLLAHEEPPKTPSNESNAFGFLLHDANQASPAIASLFNAKFDVGDLLEQHSYQTTGNGRWLYSGSTTGEAGVALLSDSNPPAIYSHHNQDPLNDGNPHDAFDVYRILEHEGDWRSAERAAQDLLAENGNVKPQKPQESQPQGEINVQNNKWPAPEPLIVDDQAEPYPVEALPNTIQDAVEEVQGFTQAPVALVASSALSAVSLSCQAIADVKRAEKLEGPTGLYFLTIADSGERKSTCDGYFMDAIHDYEALQISVSEPDIVQYKSDLETWKAQHAGLKTKISQAAKKGDLDSQLKIDMFVLHENKPTPPRVPRHFYADATPEALAWGLANNWPSAGMVSAEAGTVFGSHGMSKDSIIRNLAMLNQLWDGSDLQIDRRTSESYTVKGARLTVALQVQTATLRTFLERSEGLARGTGFLARFLISQPVSTQGTRFFREAPSNCPSLSAFNMRIREPLDQTDPCDDGSLNPQTMLLSKQAKSAWTAFHDKIEGKLCRGGNLHEVRDFASKTADNAARMAALFQVFEDGVGVVSLDHFNSAAEITAWHLEEAQRFLRSMTLPEEFVNAEKLDAWLIDYCRMNQCDKVRTSCIQKYGPSKLRKKQQLDAAVSVLEELNRARMTKSGKGYFVEVNPALLEDQVK